MLYDYSRVRSKERYFSMSAAEINVITGAFSYTGKYITRHLLARGKEV